MNQRIVNGIYFIKEKDYQIIKEKLNKKSDYFSLRELQIFTKKLS